MKPMTTHIIGIDEAGRGPLAGPVSVGVVLLKENFDKKKLLGVTDSKKLSAAKREVIFISAKQLKNDNELDYEVNLISAKEIDKKGIVPAITKALNKGLVKLMLRNKLKPQAVRVKLDGGLKASVDYFHQETIIKGDQKEYSIGLASILAKVTRDHYMEKIASKEAFLSYQFAQHKGYGTKLHREMIKKHGLSPEHRVSFCGKLIKA